MVSFGTQEHKGCIVGKTGEVSDLKTQNMSQSLSVCSFARQTKTWTQSLRMLSFLP